MGDGSVAGISERHAVAAVASVVVIEPFYGGSHRSWADSWVGQSRHDLTLITHPGEFWRWRLRGASVTLAEDYVRHVGEHGQPDAVVVSAMVDVAGLLGQARRAVGSTPVATYVHESQMLYPLAPNQRPDTSLALTNWRSLVASDSVWFNSAFHRDALRAALPRLLDTQPPPGHRHLIDYVFDNAVVLWPGVDTIGLIEAPRTERAVPRVLWNQRWDHDKNPRQVFAALVAAAARGIDFTVALAGENQQPDSAEVRWVHEHLGDRVDHYGYASPATYRELLLSSDVVVSAADHEFFGIAIVEAIAAGCIPVLPDRLSFPELIEQQWHQQTLYGPQGRPAMLRNVLSDLAGARAAVAGLRESMRRFDGTAAAAAHDDQIDRLIERGSASSGR